MPKVIMSRHLMSADTAIPYHRGDVADVSEHEAIRLVSQGYAVYAEKELLEEQSMDELKEAAEAAGVDVSGEKKKADVVKKLAQDK